MKFISRKNILIVTLSFCTLFSKPVCAAPLEKISESEYKKSAEKIANEFQITENEVENLQTNLNRAFEKLPKIEAGETAKAKVSDNLHLEVETFEENELSKNNHTVQSELSITKAARKVYHTTGGSVVKLKNRFGKTLITLKAYGVFERNGKISKPIDAYGTYKATVWNVTNKKAKKGKAAYNAYVKNTFTGKLSIGIDQVHVTLDSFKCCCTTYCNAKGKVIKPCFKDTVRNHRLSIPFGYKAEH